MTPKSVWVESILFQLKSMPPVNKWAWSRIHTKQHNPYKRQASFAECIDPINRHTSYFGKSTGSNKRSVPINRTVSSKWNQRVTFLFADCIAWVHYSLYYDNYPSGSTGHTQNHARCVAFKAMGYLTKNVCSTPICINSHIEVKNCSIHLNPSLL